MKASEVRKVSDENQYKSIQEIDEFILNRAIDGYYHLIIEDKLSDHIMVELSRNGFKIEQFKKQDEYYLRITW